MIKRKIVVLSACFAAASLFMVSCGSTKEPEPAPVEDTAEEQAEEETPAEDNAPAEEAPADDTATNGGDEEIPEEGGDDDFTVDGGGEEGGDFLQFRGVSGRAVGTRQRRSCLLHQSAQLED